jgi:dTDP-4-amino-4,6-dideoxygalactose transaminase
MTSLKTEDLIAARKAGIQKLFQFEEDLAQYTGAPYAVVTSGCTHAIELCMRYDNPQMLAFSAFTYLSVPLLMHHLQISYVLTSEEWVGEYQFHGSRIWDSARRLEPGMYRPGTMQCLSFSHSKPMFLGRAGAILLDDEEAYRTMSLWRSDGRDLRITPWEDQPVFSPGFHYCPTLELCAQGSNQLANNFNPQSQKVEYPDCRNIQIVRDPRLE